VIDITRSHETLDQRQRQAQREEIRQAARALLMTPLMGPVHEDFAAVRRQADFLRDWFSRETGWTLQIEREGARLYKRPADTSSAMRGFPDYDRRRYVLFCLACAVLERSDPQITLRLLGEKLLALSTEPALANLGFTFALTAQFERRELVAVCRTLLQLEVLQRVAGDEEAFVAAPGEQADALYDIQRRALAGILAALRGPSTWPSAEVPATFDERLRALTGEHVADSDEGRRTALRHHLARRLLDDPVVYLEELDEEARAYFINQRGVMAVRLCEITGLVAEQRAEGLALTDEAGTLTDVAMPAEGTYAHATLLVAEHLAQRYRRQQASETDPIVQAYRVSDITTFLREAKDLYGRYWRKSAREAGSERELAAIALERLEKLHLIRREEDFICALPALARFALGEADIRDTNMSRSASRQGLLA
jgi:uncharacterized protein (TIGR02678 family)